MEELTREVDELTQELIATKLSQAELASAHTAVAHEKRRLERQVEELVVETVEVHEVDYMDGPPDRGLGTGRALSPRRGASSPQVLQQRKSFPARSSRKSSRRG